MSIFTRHPRAQGVTYAAHWWTAMGIAWRLLRSTVAFAIHATLPFVSIRKPLDLEATAAYLAERNRFIAAAARPAQTGTTARPGKRATAAMLLHWVGDDPAATRSAAVLLFLWDLLEALYGLASMV